MLEAGLRAGQQGWPGARQGRAMGAPGAGICEAQALVLLALLCLGVRNSKKEPPLLPAPPVLFRKNRGAFSKEPPPRFFSRFFSPGSFVRFFFFTRGATLLHPKLMVLGALMHFLA